ncbi:MAG: hypothetical protein Q8P62_05515 [Candidatus Peregrinibacteria bacterium]|nr:hypothetical protein [Candidatus Peregrinibacteria bacterium]
MKISRKSLVALTSFLLFSAIFTGCIAKNNTPAEKKEEPKTEEQKTEEPQTIGNITYSTPTEKDIWTAEMKTAIINNYNETYPDPKTFEEIQDGYGKYSFFEVGTINTKKYKDEKLLILIVPCDGMCFSNDTYRFAYNETTKALTLLKKHSSSNEYSLPLIQEIAPTTDSVATLAGLDAPDKILIPGTDKYAQLEVKDATNTFVTMTYNPLEGYDTKNIDETLGITIYSHSKSTTESTFDGCFRVLLPDGTISVYSFQPNFEKAITNKYDFTAGGCGITGTCYMISDLTDSALTKTTKSSGDINFYAPKDPTKDKTTLDNYERFKVQQAWKVEQDPTLKTLSLDEFIAMEPLLYWQDPAGRWSSIINKEVKPAAECGKPVIYLCPEKTTDVSVQVGIEKLTKTIPEYKNGWRVSAEPNGTLYNYDDTKTYPYLFWEGQNKGVLNATKGSSVKRTDLKKFLNDSLNSLGLNSTEKQDFMDFWLSRMLDNKEEYFFVSFVGTRDFNKVAPLKISPAPDTLIRVFMYYMPLDKPMRTEKQDLKSIERNGFTVVEWGGTSSVPWLE